MCKIISIASCKGGVGKSTTVMNLGTALAMQGNKVLAVDNDAQASLTKFLIQERSPEVSLPDLIKAVMENATAEEIEILTEQSITKTKHIDLITSNIKMAGLEIGMAMITNRERVLEEILQCVRGNYDFILIDNAPSLGIFVVNALTASDSVIIPVETHYAALEGFDLIIDSIKMVKRKLNPKLEIEGVIMTKHQEITTMCKTIRELIKSECGGNIRLFDTPVPYSIKVAESPAFGTSIFEHDKKNSAGKVYEKIAWEVAENGK